MIISRSRTFATWSGATPTKTAKITHHALEELLVGDQHFTVAQAPIHTLPQLHFEGAGQFDGGALLGGAVVITSAI
jgi:hypothetical protein